MMAANTHLTVDPEAAIEYYLNEGWNGKGWSPYDLLLIGECALATGSTRRGNTDPDAPANAEEYRQIMLDRARQRWMAGFYADPFAKEPMRRRLDAAPSRRAA